MNITKDRVVNIHYKLSTADGQEVDSSEGGEPLPYLHGHGNIVAGLENALEGKVAGDHVSVKVPPEEGYGAYDDQLDLQVPKDAFPEEMWVQMKPGMSFVAEHPTIAGKEVVYRVFNVQDEGAVLSGNHPLAGETLAFEVDVVDVREATIAEIERGHLHAHSCGGGCGGHDHGCEDQGCGAEE